MMSIKETDVNLIPHRLGANPRRGDTNENCFKNFRKKLLPREGAPPRSVNRIVRSTSGEKSCGAVRDCLFPFSNSSLSMLSHNRI